VGSEMCIRDSGGELRCRSAPGEGTTFEIEIPLVSGQNPEPTQNPDSQVN